MTKFNAPSFSVPVGSEAYRQNYDAIFGPKDPAIAEPKDPTPVKKYNADEHWHDTLAALHKAVEDGTCCKLSDTACVMILKHLEQFPRGDGYWCLNTNCTTRVDKPYACCEAHS